MRPAAAPPLECEGVSVRLPLLLNARPVLLLRRADALKPLAVEEESLVVEGRGALQCCKRVLSGVRGRRRGEGRGS